MWSGSHSSWGTSKLEAESDSSSQASSKISKKNRQTHHRHGSEKNNTGGVLSMLAQSVVGGGSFTPSGSRNSSKGREFERTSLMWPQIENLGSIARPSRKFGGKSQLPVMGNMAAVQLPDDALVVAQQKDPYSLSIAAWQSPLTGWCDIQNNGLAKPASRGPALMSEPPSAPGARNFPFLNNRPSVRNKIERYHIQEGMERERGKLHSPTNARHDTWVGQVPLATGAFLAQHAINASASSCSGATQLASNILQQNGSQWCSRALEPNTHILAALAARDASLCERKSLSQGSRTSQNSLTPPSSVSSVNSVMSLQSIQTTKKIADSLRKRSSTKDVDEKKTEELMSDADPYESRAEWVDVFFRNVMLLGSFAIKWGRHHAEKYTILVPADHGGETDRYPYWLPSTLAPAFTLPGENADGKWNIVHEESHGQGGTDIIRFIGGPVCCRRLRIRMTKPGDVAGRKLSECFYSICLLGAIPFHAPGLGIGLRAEYFKDPPDRGIAMHAQPRTSRLEPIRVSATKTALNTSGLQGDNLGDGRLGPAPGTNVKQRQQEDEAKKELTQLRTPAPITIYSSPSPSQSRRQSLAEPELDRLDTPSEGAGATEVAGDDSKESLTFASFSGWLKITQSGSYIISLQWPEAGGVAAIACAEYVEEKLTPVVKRPDLISGGGYKYRPEVKTRFTRLADSGDETITAKTERKRKACDTPYSADVATGRAPRSARGSLLSEINEDPDDISGVFENFGSWQMNAQDPLIVHLWINLDPILPEGGLEEASDFHGELMQGQQPLRFAVNLHAGCHAFIIEAEFSSSKGSIPGLLLSYSGPDTGDVMIAVPPAVLAPPAMADASLDSLYVKPGATNGLMGFDPSCREHSLPLLPNEVDQVVFSVYPARPWGRIFLMSSNHRGEIETDEHRLLPGAASKPLQLDAGESSVFIRVVAPDLRTRATYTIYLARDTWRNCQLEELSVSTPSALGYVCYRSFDVPKDGAQDVIAIPELPYMALTATIKATTRNKDAFIYIAKGPSKHRLEDEENLGASGEPHKPISLHVGRNILYVRVLSPDRQLTMNWTIVINRHASSDATLKVISIEPCGFRKFLPSADNYQVGAALPSSCHEVAVWVEANHDDAKLYVSANDPRRCAIKRGQHRFDHRYQVSGMRVSLRVGWNTIFIRVVAMDSTTSKTYAFHCMRRPMPLLDGLLYLGAGLKVSAAVGEVPAELQEVRSSALKSRITCLELIDQKQAKMPEPLWRVSLNQLKDFKEKLLVDEDGLDDSFGKSPWLHARFGAPLMIVGVRVHWKNKPAPRFKVLVRGETPAELARFPKGETLTFISACGDINRRACSSIGRTKGSSVTDVTPSGWRVEHKSEKISDVIDQTSDMPKLNEIWRCCCIGEGTKPAVLPEPFCATELRIDLIAPYFSEEDLVVDRIELVPLSISKLYKQVGYGFVGEFFFASPQQLQNGLPPDLSALEPSLDGSDANTLSMRMPCDYQDTQEAWAAQYVGILDVRDPGLYTFWVETKRFRNDQTLVWRFSVDGKVLMPTRDSDSLSQAKYQGSSKSRLTKRNHRRTSAEKNLLGTISGRSSDSDLAIEPGFFTPPDQDERYSDCAERSKEQSSGGSRMSVAQAEDAGIGRKSIRIRNSTITVDSTNASQNEKQRSKVLNIDEEECSGSADDFITPSGNTSRRSTLSVRSFASPSVHSHASSLQHSLQANKKSRLSLKNGSKNRRWMTVNCIAAMSQGSAIPSGMEVMLVPGGHHLRIEVLTQVHDSPVMDLFEEAPDSRRSTIPQADFDDFDKSPASSIPRPDSCDTSVKMNLAYCGPDTNGHVIVVPSTNVAPPPTISAGPDLYTNLLLPTAPLVVTTEIAETWNQASGIMTQWLEEEIFLEQLHGLSIHSIEQEDHFQGACQVAAVHNRTLHGTIHLRGLRYKEWEYSTDRVPESVLETAAQFLSSPSRRFVGIASASDAVYDATHMKQVLPNVLVVWYLEQDASTEPITQGELGRRKSARESIRATLFRRTTLAVRGKLGHKVRKQRSEYSSKGSERDNMEVEELPPSRSPSRSSSNRKRLAGSESSDFDRAISTESGIDRQSRKFTMKMTGDQSLTTTGGAEEESPWMSSMGTSSFQEISEDGVHPRTVMFQSGVCSSADEVVYEVTRWLRKMALRKGDVLGFTVHPVRAPGTPKQRSETSENCEWVIFYRDPGVEHARVIAAGGRTPLVAVQGLVLQTQKSWNWHFNQLTGGEMNAQGLVACTSTTVMKDGRCECLQLVLWQAPIADEQTTWDLDASVSRSPASSHSSVCSPSSLPIWSRTNSGDQQVESSVDGEATTFEKRPSQSSLEQDMDGEGMGDSSLDFDMDGEGSVAYYRQMLEEGPEPLPYRQLCDRSFHRHSKVRISVTEEAIPVVNAKVQGIRSLDVGTLEVFFCYDFDQNEQCMTWEWCEQEKERVKRDAILQAADKATEISETIDDAGDGTDGLRGSALEAAQDARQPSNVANGVAKDFLAETLFPKALANVIAPTILQRRTYPVALHIQHKRARQLARHLLWNMIYPTGTILSLETYTTPLIV